MCHNNQCFYPLKMKHENLLIYEGIRFAQITTFLYKASYLDST